MQEKWIQQTADHVKGLFANDATGHDWWHLYRVWQLSKYIGEKEGVDQTVCQLGALLHDIADFKFHGGDLSVGPQKAKEWLMSIGVDPSTQEAVAHIVGNVSFKGAKVTNTMKSLEGFVVQDADRLDAIGAIGIARTFAYGGSQGLKMHEPGKKATLHESFEQYQKLDNTSINHFYEKLLLLKEKMNTKTGRELAEKRHRFMERYLDEFYSEWDGGS